MNENIQNLTKHGEVQYLVDAPKEPLKRVFISRNEDSKTYSIEIFNALKCIESDDSISLLQAYYDAVGDSFYKYEYQGSEEYAVLYASAVAGHQFSALEVKAIKMAVNAWFTNTGSFTALGLYDWVMTEGEDKEDFPEDVIPNQANAETWPSNAVEELRGLAFTLLDAIRWGVGQEKDEPDTISLKWCVDDVLGQMEGRDETLTRDQAREVLAIIEHRHDACIGVSWDVIDCHIDMYLDDLKKAVAK